MKKLSITGQIAILFSFVLIISVALFTIVTASRLKYVAEQETYTRLITYSSLLDSHEARPDEVIKDMQIGFVQIRKNAIVYSNDISEYMSEKELQNVLDGFAKQNKPSLKRRIINLEGKTIYYVANISADGQGINLIMTNSLYVNNFSRRISFQLIMAFIIIICLATICVVIWSNQFTKRLHQLQGHILELPKNGYNISYQDDGLDEVGELSRAIETMRIEIEESERQKQEMLQNMSHDFKTPIAVIKSYAEAQQDGMADENSSKIIIAQAEILKNKVNRLLQYNSLEYLEKNREFEDVDMKEVVEEVVMGYKFQTELNIELDLTEDIFFKGYRENYFTIVDNIIDNARRYAKTKIKVVLKKDRLRIYNDGEPIDEQFIKHSFKPYEKGSKGEFGLGMSIVQKTVDFFGMHLIVKNEPIGVSFIITK
ncbi:MAG: HAMP domain-containing histidine kinase [Roseburia sp.]|nr:HAMP domain-containing histidine kinase [Anaeroplasma bactoclasticum]MCM1195736.1 HAMP domain-containing histidine kinase [Roseburia sp.]MCM1556086.1 HAMP domain-containing histidine kinase [Anaeroplasma bactoclasticum]